LREKQRNRDYRGSVKKTKRVCSEGRIAPAGVSKKKMKRGKKQSKESKKKVGGRGKDYKLDRRGIGGKSSLINSQDTKKDTGIVNAGDA